MEGQPARRCRIISGHGVGCPDLFWSIVFEVEVISEVASSRKNEWLWVGQQDDYGGKMPRQSPITGAICIARVIDIHGEVVRTAI